MYTGLPNLSDGLTLQNPSQATSEKDDARIAWAYLIDTLLSTAR